MGKGDKKSRRGKIWIGSFGVSRPKKLKNKKSGTKRPVLAEEVVKKAKKGEKNK